MAVDGAFGYEQASADLLVAQAARNQMRDLYGLAIGYLVFRSAFIPRVIGLLLAIGALSYLTYSFTTVLSPGFAHHLVPYVQLPSLVGEGSFCLWLLLVGVNVQRWNEHASAASSRLGWAQ